MELHPPRRLAPAEGVAVVVVRARQHGGALRRAQHALLVGGLGEEAVGQAGEQRIVRGCRQKVDSDRTHLASVRVVADLRSEEHTSELQSLMRSSYTVFSLTKKKR